MASGDYAGVAKQFVDFYYATFDNDRKQLAPLYRDNSMLTFESQSVGSSAAIIEKLSNLPFQKVRHEVSTLDAQPNNEGGVLVLITGRLLVDEEQNPMNFSQVFQLLPDGQGSFFVFNDIFKLVFG